MIEIDPRDVANLIPCLTHEEARAAWFLQAHGPQSIALELLKAFPNGGPGNSRIAAGGSGLHCRWEEAEPDELAMVLRAWLRRDTSRPNRVPYEEQSRLLLALTELERRRSELKAVSFYRTNIGSIVWNTLDECLRTRRCGVIEGLPGRGKSATCEAFFEAHKGQCRYLRTAAYDAETDFFHQFAEALLLPHQYGSSPILLRRALEAILKPSGLFLIVDEAQRLLPNRNACKRPKRLEWIMELADSGVPIVLIGTDRLANRICELESPDWNGEQFRRRFAARWINLPERTAPADLGALVERSLPGLGQRCVDAAVEYAGTLRDVSGLFDLVKDVREIALSSGRRQATASDFKLGLKTRLSSDGAMEAAFQRQNIRRRRSACSPALEAVQPACNGNAAPLQLPRRGGSVAVENDFAAPEADQTFARRQTSLSPVPG